MSAADRIQRKYIGTRVGYGLAAVLCYFGTLLTLAFIVAKVGDVLDQKLVWSALEVLLYVLGGAIVGDTARPSGMKHSPFAVGRRGNKGGREDG